MKTVEIDNEEKKKRKRHIVITNFWDISFIITKVRGEDIYHFIFIL